MGAGAILAGIILLLCHAALLQRCAEVLIDETHLPNVDRVWVRWHEFTIDGEGALDEAAVLCGEDPTRGVITVGVAPMPVVRAGVLPRQDILIARELEKRGVASDKVAVLSGEARDVWEEVQRLGEWLNGHRNSRVLLLCDRFGSAQMRCIIERTLPPEAAARVGIRGLPRQGVDETNWWKTRSGVKFFLFAALDRSFQWIQGKDRLVNERWDFEAYEESLRRRIEEERS